MAAKTEVINKQARFTATTKAGKHKARTEVITKVLMIPELDLRLASFTIVGDAPLIVNAFNAKILRQIADAQQGLAKGGREFKNPEECIKNAYHYTKNGKYGFPSIAFKLAAVSACTSAKAMTKTAALQAFHVIGDMVEIIGKPTPREDMVRVGRNKSVDIRYRPEFREWKCVLKIKYNARVISEAQLVTLLNTAGFAVGVGEWRVEKKGQMGLFHVQ